MHIPNKLHHEVIPGILEQEWDPIAKKLELIKPFAKSVHIDLLDGVFAPNKTWIDPAPFAQYAKDFTLEVHMMVDNPIQYIKPFADAGFTRFIGQIERMPDMVNFVAEAEMYGEVGLALDTTTQITDLHVSLEDLDFVFVMTVKAGFSNQSFLPDMMQKVKDLRTKNQFIPIEVDGGISATTIVQAKDAGATRFVSTGFLYNNGNNPQEQYDTLCGLVK